MKKLLLILTFVTLSNSWTIAFAGSKGFDTHKPPVRIQSPRIPTLGTNIMPKSQTISGISVGGNGSGGGDICENRIKVIRSDLRSWINREGSKNLKLPTGGNSSQYTKLMLDQINQANILCVGSGDSEYPVTVHHRPKVCKFTNSPESRIICDHNKFMSLNENDQYTLIHHEYAGLAGIENPSGADSNYDISNQISAFLVDTTIKQLAIKEDTGLKRKIICTGLQDYYPTEIILSVQNKKVMTLMIKEQEGEISQLVRNPKLPNVFSYTNENLILNYLVTLSEDLRTAAYTIIYKKSGEALSSETLTCQ